MCSIQYLLFIFFDLEAAKVAHRLDTLIFLSLLDLLQFANIVH